MKSSGRLVLVAILALTLLAPSGYPQNRTELALADLMKDMLTLKSTIDQLQNSSSQRNTEMKALVEQVLARFAPLDASLNKLSDSIASMKATDAKSAQELEALRKLLTTVEGNVGKVSSGVNELVGQVGRINKELVAIKTKEEPLPSAITMFQAGLGMYSAAFYDLAISEFREFLRNYPNDPMAAAAYIYIGDSIVALKKYDQANFEYDAVLQKFPNSDRKCSALYKKGQIHAQLKENTEAIDAYTRIDKECPGTQEAELAKALLSKLNPPRGGRGQGK